MKLSNQVALVLGSIKGIGKAVGLDLARSGARVVYTHHDWPEALDDLKRDAAAAGEHLIVEVDLTQQAAVKSLIDRVIARFGRLDILVNNIERGGWPVVHGAYTQDQWDLEVATTLRAKQWVFSAALPHLKRATEGGVVINLSSIAGLVGRSGPAAFLFNEGYAAANRGIALLTETWARLGAPTVRVNEIMLGIFETRHAQGTRGWGLLSEAQQLALRDHTLLARTGRLDDVIKAVRFLIRDAPFMTGSVIRLDGGYVLGGEKIAPMPQGVE